MKTTLKKLLALTLAVIMIFGAAPILGIDFSTQASAETQGIYDYDVTDGKATITDCDESVSGAITIPSTLGGYPVTSIGCYAFSSCDALTSINIPSGVTSIGWYAFNGCESLTSINIPASVTSIGECAFSGTEYYNNLSNWTKDVLYIDTCLIEAKYSLTGYYNIATGTLMIADNAFYCHTAITGISIPMGVRSIGNGAFSACEAITDISIPSSVTSIGDYAFSHCTLLESVNISEGVTSIGYGAFKSCHVLESITIPASVTSIDNTTDGVFSYCTALRSIVVDAQNPNYSSDENGVLFNKDKTTLIQCPEGITKTAYDIPFGVTCIGDAAFNRCFSLESITIPASVKSIGYSAFEACNSLATANIPASVTSIGGYAFFGCSPLSSIIIPDSVTSIGSEAFACTAYYENDANWTDKVLYIDNWLVAVEYDLSGSYNVIDGTRAIVPCAFDYCSDLISVTIPSSVISIGEWAFSYCESLVSVTFAEGSQLKSINDSTFSFCDSLANVNIPTGVTSIGHAAFHSTALTSIIIPASVISIDDHVFYGDSSLTSVTFAEGSNLESIGSNVFNYCSFTSITIPASVTSIKDTFQACSKLESIIVENENVNYSSDENGVLYDKQKTTLIRYPEGNKNTAYEVPNSVTNIGGYAFADCGALASITIPSSVTSIGNGTFEHCDSLTSIIIPPSVMSIGDYAFSYCNNLEYVHIEYVHIPSSVTTIGEGILDETTAYICSDTSTCYAKTYANANGITFIICNGNHEAPIPVAVTGVSVLPTALTIAPGSHETLTATVLPSNAANKAVTWTSNNPAVATVNANGVVSAASVGTAVITVRTADGNKTATCTVTVAIVPVSSVTLNASSRSVYNGSTSQLTANVLPSNAANKAVTWASSNPAVATVNANGVVNAVSVGTAVITVTTADGGKTATCEVTVSAAPVEEIQLNIDNKSVTPGSAITLTVSVVSPGTVTVIWTSSNPAVATVDQNGVVTAVSNGTAVITASAGGQTASCTFTVRNYIGPESITVTNAPVELKYRETVVLDVIVSPVDAIYSGIRWDSSNPSAVYADSNGITAMGEGTAIITATAVDALGNPIIDENNQTVSTQFTVTAKMTFFQKLMEFLLRLFGWL